VTEDRYTLEWIPGSFAIARYPADERIPSWALDADGFMSISRTEDELSILAMDKEIPFNAQAERGWVAFRIAGSFDINATGILASLLGPLADAGVSILAFSTYDTDIILIHESDKETAVDALNAYADTSKL
jgi:hypothetical protein